VALPLHVSLSRTLHIKTEDREAFLENLTSSLRRAAVHPFHTYFSGLKWVPNFERNRWFLVLGLEKPERDELNRLLNVCNEVAEKCGHPALYTGGLGDGPMDVNYPSTNIKRRRKSVQQLNEEEVGKPSLVDRTENFHVSIAWNLAEPDPNWLTLVRNINMTSYKGLTMTSFDAVKAKIGNVVNSIDLGMRSSGLGAQGGLLGGS
jgi:hypothetical protein